MSDKLRTTDLLKYFNGVEDVTHRQIFDFYKEMEINLAPSTIRWRIYELKKRGIIYSLGGGLYSFGYKQYFEPELTSGLKSLHDYIVKNFPHTRFCLWYTPWLNQFMHHQPFTNNIIVEVERYTAKSVFQFVRSKIPNTLINPGFNDLENYGDSESILMTILLDEAPTRKYKGITIPTLEKLLVDIFSSGPLYITYQGREMDIFFKNALRNYAINFSKLFRYAKRRNFKSELREYIEKSLGININYFKDHVR